MAVFPLEVYEKSCPKSTTIQNMTAMIDDLDRTWVTTGYYTWQEMANIVAATTQLAGAASSAAISFFSGDSTPDMKEYVRARANAYSEISGRANEYTAIWQKAKATGTPINAPGLRRWVIDDLRASLDLMRAIEVSQCARPWFLGALTGFMGFFINVAAIAKTIGKLVIKAGEVVLDAADTALGLWPVLKWGLIAVAAAFAGVYTWGHLKRLQGRFKPVAELPRG